jgi:hypothetical protein
MQQPRSTGCTVSGMKQHLIDRRDRMNRMIEKLVVAQNNLLEVIVSERTETHMCTGKLTDRLEKFVDEDLHQYIAIARFNADY